MKILRVITRLNIGGPSHQAQHLHLEFSRRGHDCTLVHGPVGSGEGDHRFLDDKGVISLSNLTQPIRPLKDLSCLKQMVKLLTSEPYDILHTHTAKAGLLGRLAALIAKSKRLKKGFPRLKVIHTYHGHVFRGYFGPLMTKLILSVERWLSRHTDHLITLSPTLAQEISTYLNTRQDRMEIVPLGLHLLPYVASDLSTEFNQRFKADKTHWIGWVGRMTQIKNPKGLLKIASHMKKLNPMVGFVMVGDGPLRTEVQRKIQELNLEDCVFLTGWEKDMSNMIPSFGALINTSFNEGTPVAILEALASGTPVLCTDVGGSHDILPKGEPVAVYRAGEEENQIQILLKWLNEKNRVSTSARNHIANHYSVERLAADLSTIYATISYPEDSP